MERSRVQRARIEGSKGLSRHVRMSLALDLHPGGPERSSQLRPRKIRYFRTFVRSRPEGYLRPNGDVTPVH